MSAFVANTNVLELNGLKNEIADTFINDATVTVTIKDAEGVNVVGASWPMTMDYVTDSEGNYRAILADTLTLTPKAKYVAYISANGGVGLKGFWEFTFKPLTPRIIGFLTMAFIVETGAGVENANSYVAEADFDAYCDARAVTPATGDAEAALVRATQFIDAQYRSRFPGSKVGGRDQALQWPRTGAEDDDGDEIAEDEIPDEIKDAVCEAAIRELTEPGAMQPDLERGGDIRRLKAGSVEIEYGGAASAQTTFTIIDNILSGLLTSSSGGITATTVRG